MTSLRCQNQGKLFYNFISTNQQENRNMNANQKSSCLKYPAEYVAREHPDKQIAIWAKFLPRLDAVEIHRMLPYPMSKGVEDCFIVPKPRAVAPSFAESVWFMLNCAGIDAREIPPDVLAECSSRTREAMSIFSRAWRGDFWLVPGQLGFYRRGESMKRVRGSYAENEFGFDIYLNAAALVSHPGRLTGEQWELGVNCPGNNNYTVNGSLPKAPCLESFAGRRACNLNIAIRSNPRFGSATGFIPKS